MSNINLQRFVDIDIVYHATPSLVSTRDTVVYFEDNELNSVVYKSYAEVEAVEGVSAKFKAWAKVYFDNGGGKIHYVNYSGTLTVAALKALPDEEIVVYVATNDDNSTDYADAVALATSMNADSYFYGIHQKIILTSTNLAIADSTVENLAVKYASTANSSATIAAYLSKIDVYRRNVIEDYCYTEESVGAEPADDEVLGNVLTNNMNVDMTLAGRILNLGGNMKNGADLTNSFTLIVLQQLLTQRLLQLLITKIKGSAGLSEIQSVVADEMTMFMQNGYLTTDKIWKEDDLVITYNNQSYTIIEKNEPLLLGYKFVILPIQSLTEADKQARKTPPMYLVVADSYGIRKVTINGEVI